MNKNHLLEPYRKKIDALDDKIIDLLIERENIIKQVAELKGREGIPAVIPERVEEVRERSADRADAHGLDPDLVRKLYTLIIDYSCELENQLMDQESSSKGHDCAA
jgi:chorismate mutase-like protein